MQTAIFNPISIFPPGSGVSNLAAREKVVEYVLNKVQPNSILDLGCGVGLYGYQIRLYDKDVRLIGVDVAMKYLTSMFCQSLYNVLIQAKIEDVVYGKIKVERDITIMMSTIEHFDKEDAEIILGTLDKVIISTPMFPMVQPSEDGNKYQEHRCWFSQAELEELGYSLLFKTEYPGGHWPGFCGIFQKGVKERENNLGDQVGDKRE